MRTREELEEHLGYKSGDIQYPDLAIKRNIEVIAEILLDIRDLLTQKQSPTHPENTGTPLPEESK